MKFTILLIVLISTYTSLFSQTVNILYANNVFAPIANVQASYEASFGVGNVTIVTGALGTLSNANHDVLYVNSFGGGAISVADFNNIITFIQNGGHVIISTEGRGYAGGGRFMSSLWNAVTGQSITETGAGASGTGSPPRFHNSNGPWNSSPDLTINGGTGSYASFANFNALNVIHQRNTTAPSCGNIEGVSASFPARPNMGDGTLYINGECWFPFGGSFGGGGITGGLKNHAEALARMHYALITNDQVLLDQLNTWEANLVVDDDFIGNDTTICKGDFNPFVKNCPVYASYSWEDVQGNVLATSPNYMIQDSGTYIIKTTGTFPQCDGIDTLHVMFNPNPLSSFTVNEVCQGEQTVFTNNSTINAPGIIQTILWEFGDGSTDNVSSASYTYANAGSYNVKLTNTSDQACMHDTTISVVVNSEPIANFNVLDDCLYNDPVFSESSTVGTGSIVSWDWNFGDVMPSSTVQSTDQVPSYSYTQDGTYSVSLIVTTDNGCDDTLIQNTVRFPIPQVSISLTPACKNDSVLVDNNSTINAPDNITSWIWNYGDGSPLVSQFEQNHKYTQDGYFNVTLIASSNNGCVSDLTDFVQVYPLPIAEFSSTTACENGSPTNFFNFSTVSQGSIIDYVWDFDDNGATSNLQFGNHNYSSAGSYNVQLNVQTAFGCKDSIEHSVVVNPKPEADFIADVKVGCYPYCTGFQDNSVSNASSITDYFWFFGNGEVSLSQDPTVCFENLSHTDDMLYNSSLIVTNDLGCKDTLVEVDYITVWPKPLADFIADPLETDMYNSLINFENTSEGADGYEWDYNDGVQSSSFEEEHIYSDTGIFVPQLIATTINNCKDTTDLIIKVNPVLNVYIPSAFTPDGDGVNDVFFVQGFAIDFDKFEFSIFDRWGALVYYTEENKPWDGTYKGDPSPQDTYVYLVRLRGPEGKDKEYEGHFNLLR